MGLSNEQGDEMNKKECVDWIDEVESALAKSRVHFTDYDEAGEDIEDLEAELKVLRAKLAGIESEEANAGEEE